MRAALLVASTRTNGIPMDAFDLDDLKASQLQAPLQTDQVQSTIQGRRQTQRFEHEDFMGRNNGFKKTQAWSRCAESAHNAKTCKIELGDHTRRRVDGRSSFIP